MKHLSGWLLAGALLAAGAVAFSSRGTAADDKEIRDAVNKMADAIEKFDGSAAQRGAQALQKADLDVIMEIFKLRSKGGLGLGAANSIKPDGIEAKIQALDKTAPTPKEAESDSAALTRAGYIAAAIAQAVVNKVPTDKKKQEAQWKMMANEMSKAGMDFATAAKSKDAAKLHKAAKDLNNSCIKCHDVFR